MELWKELEISQKGKAELQEQLQASGRRGGWCY